MDAFKIIVKLFVEKDTFAPHEFIPVFHRWIQNGSVAEHLLIDVADYAHVPDGPGTLLVSSEANIHMDRGNDRLGLMYVRKLPIAGNFRARLLATLNYALTLAGQLENEPEFAGRLKFRTDEIAIRINDRLLAPNTQATFNAVKVDLQAAGEQLFGQDVKLKFTPTPLGLFEVTLLNSVQPALS